MPIIFGVYHLTTFWSPPLHMNATALTRFTGPTLFSLADHCYQSFYWTTTAITRPLLLSMCHHCNYLHTSATLGFFWYNRVTNANTGRTLLVVGHRWHLALKHYWYEWTTAITGPLLHLSITAIICLLFAFVPSTQIHVWLRQADQWNGSKKI